MGAGKYRDRVTVEQFTEGTAGSDGWRDRTDDANWSTYLSKWSAEVVPTGGREFVSGQKVQSDVTYIVTMRWSSETKVITPDMRFRTSSQKLEIVSAYPVGNKNREMVFQCKEATT